MKRRMLSLLLTFWVYVGSVECTCSATGADDCIQCGAGKHRAVSGGAALHRPYRIVLGGGSYHRDTEMSVQIRGPSGAVLFTVYGGGYPGVSASEMSPRTVDLVEGETYTVVPADSNGNGWNGGSAQVMHGDSVEVQITSAEGEKFRTGLWGCLSGCAFLGESDAKTFTVGVTCRCNAGSVGPDKGACTQCVAGKYKSLAEDTNTVVLHRPYTIVLGGWRTTMYVQIRDPSGAVLFTVYSVGYPDVSVEEVSPRTVDLAEGETYTIVPADSYGGGWSGGSAQVMHDGSVEVQFTSVEGKELHV